MRRTCFAWSTMMSVRRRGNFGLGLVDDEGLIEAVAGTGCVEADGAAVSRRGARHRGELSVPALVEGRGAGHLLGRAPGAARLAHDERLVTAGAVHIGPAGTAVACRGTRHLDHRGVPALVEGRDAGHRLGRTPGAVRLAHDERLVMTRAVGVVGPAGAAVARRGARHRGDLSVPALVEGRDAGHLLRCAPGAALLAHDERLVVAGAVGVVPAGA